MSGYYEMGRLSFKLNRFVCSFEKAFNMPTLFRTYVTEATKKAAIAQDCSIWEAARATSAAATFFDPMTIGHQSYVDGATGFNNPVEIVLEEARDIWPDALSRIQSIVSIGTGVPEPKDFGDDLRDILLTLKAIATETERTHMRFLKNHDDLGLKDRYFRFNVNQGLRDIRLDDHAKVHTIEAAARLYLASPQVRTAASLFVNSPPPKEG
jgi:predicted acylesterase/phospholipase RssA